MRWKSVKPATSTKTARQDTVPASHLLRMENARRKRGPGKKEITASAMTSAPVGCAIVPKALREIPAQAGRNSPPAIMACAERRSQLAAFARWTNNAHRANATAGRRQTHAPVCGVSALLRKGTWGRKATTAITTTSAPVGFASALTTPTMAIPAKIG